MQLPFFTEKHFKNMRKDHPTEFSDYLVFLKASKERKKKILTDHFTLPEVDSIIQAVSMFPNYTMTASVVTDGFDNICKNDVVFLNLKITRPSGEKYIGMTHSLYLEMENHETIYIAILGKNGKVIHFSRETIYYEESWLSMCYKVEEEGEQEIIFQLYSFHYQGLDTTEKLTFTALPLDEKRKEILERMKEREPEKIEKNWMQTILGPLFPVEKVEVNYLDEDVEQELEDIQAVEENDDDKEEAKIEGQRRRRNRRTKED